MTCPRLVSVFLNQETVYARPGDGYEPLFGHVKAIDFTVESTSPEAACEIAYAITHSSPNELHCPISYLDVVMTYRDLGGFRAMRVGDILAIDGERYLCTRFGFSRVPV